MQRCERLRYSALVWIRYSKYLNFGPFIPNECSDQQALVIPVFLCLQFWAEVPRPEKPFPVQNSSKLFVPNKFQFWWINTLWQEPFSQKVPDQLYVSVLQFYGVYCADTELLCVMYIWTRDSKDDVHAYQVHSGGETQTESVVRIVILTLMLLGTVPQIVSLNVMKL